MSREKREVDDKREGAWAEDQREHGYYYDDAHGYETYEPETDAESDDEPANREDETKRPDLAS